MPLLLIALSTALLFWLQAAFFHRFAQRGLSASLTFEEAMVTEGDRAVLVETLVNRKALPLASVRATFHLDRSLHFVDDENATMTDRTYRNDIYSLSGYEKLIRRLEVHCTRRGWYPVEELTLSTSDLFFFQTHFKRHPQQAGLLVCPGAVDAEKLEVPFRRLLGTLLTRRRTLEDPFELQGIRPYQSYDGMKNINWKASARTGEYQVNLHPFSAGQQVKILLDLEGNEVWGQTALLEEGIRIAAAYAQALIRQGIPVSIVTNGVNETAGEPVATGFGAGSEHIRTLQEMLARVETVPTSNALREFICQERKEGNTDTIYVLVSPAQEPFVQAEYEMLCQQSDGGQWIVLLRAGAIPQIDGCPSADVVPWEVAYD